MALTLIIVHGAMEKPGVRRRHEVAMAAVRIIFSFTL
jgi:hypothetical protein